eukprot:m.75716 g.75716  ORF g.75716 m.75716 type:complete len:52 (+) comp8092_c0_seq2:1155-1310(+)
MPARASSGSSQAIPMSPLLCVLKQHPFHRMHSALDCNFKARPQFEIVIVIF